MADRKGKMIKRIREEERERESKRGEKGGG